MAKKYEYHKQNEYPGERVAEKKRVADREEAADKRADARVAAKERKNEALMDSEVARSTNRAARVNRKRDSADSIGVLVIVGLVVIILAGAVWGYMAMEEQSDRIDAQNNEINTLRSQLVSANSANNENVESSSEAEQVRLYKDFVLMTNNVKREIGALEDYNMIYSNTYQLCSGFIERENSVNQALYRFAEKEIVYYNQIADLADMPECKPKIETMRSAMEESRIADERVYVLTKDLCYEITDDVISEEEKSRLGWDLATEEAVNKAKAFDEAEKSVIECFT